ncbi:hypothetical protein [Nocardioides endophyticus]|uniref:hypothetical protein n=1 Tax=Nocardioides endophyticus TaxID=1353775 RepID=UPI0031EA5BE8
MSDNSTRPIAGHAIVMALVAWSMFAAVGGVVSGGHPVARVLCLVWFALGAWLLVRRWRSRP